MNAHGPIRPTPEGVPTNHTTRQAFTDSNFNGTCRAASAMAKAGSGVWYVVEGTGEPIWIRVDEGAIESTGTTGLCVVGSAITKALANPPNIFDVVIENNAVSPIEGAIFDTKPVVTMEGTALFSTSIPTATSMLLQGLAMASTEA